MEEKDLPQGTLVVWLTNDEGSWMHCRKLIEDGSWQKVIIIGDKEARKAIVCSKDTDFLEVDKNKLIPELSQEISALLSKDVPELEVYVNFVSGRGREHMALISALLASGLSFRLVSMTEKGIREL